VDQHGDGTREAIVAQYLKQRQLGPKYLRFRDAILSLVESRLLRVGQALPSEQDLARAVPLSLGTIQKALGVLATEGVVVRRHGHGSFVAAQPTVLPDPWHFRFVDDDGRTLLPVYVHITSRRIVRQPGPWSRFLGEDPGGHIRITRLVDVNHEFFCFNQFYLPATRFAEMLTAPLSELGGANLKLVISDRYGIVTQQVTQLLRAGRFPDYVCKAIGVRRNTVGAMLELHGLSHRNAPVYYQDVFIPPSGRRLDVSVRQPESAGLSLSRRPPTGRS
jgi:GntR family transcriptional regulator